MGRFAAATTAMANNSPPPTRSPPQRERKIKAAEKELADNRRVKPTSREKLRHP